MRTLIPNSSYDDQQDYSAFRRRVFGKLLETSQDRILMLWQADSPLTIAIAEKLKRCCQAPQIVSMNDGERYYLTESRCRSRLCPRCAKIRANILGQRIKQLITLMDNPRFLTLTIRSDNRSLRAQLKHLRKKFACMRRSPEWGHYVTGGIYTVEITFNKETRQWHPHIHAIVDGDYFPHSSLLMLWNRINHDTCGVDIRKVHGVHKLANYLACYVAKSCDLEHLEPDQFVEWAVETQSLRLAQTFGSMHGVQLANDRVVVNSYKQMQVNVNTLALKAESGDGRCEEVLKILLSSDPCDRPDFLQLVAHAIPPPPPLYPPCKPVPLHKQLHLKYLKQALTLY